VPWCALIHGQLGVSYAHGAQAPAGPGADPRGLVQGDCWAVPTHVPSHLPPGSCTKQALLFAGEGPRPHPTAAASVGFSSFSSAASRNQASLLTGSLCPCWEVVRHERPQALLLVQSLTQNKRWSQMLMWADLGPNLPAEEGSSAQNHSPTSRKEEGQLSASTTSYHDSI
jgi:hypothetical protein